MNTQSHKNQRGMVSIMVTMMMMLVITLIVLGFAQITRQEQRQSLDRQLSTQALFAAESAVNDARQVILTAQANGQPIPQKSNCAADTNYAANPVIDTTNQVSYPCLLVNTELANININPLPATGNSVQVPLEPSGATISTLHINWKSKTAPANQGLISSNCKNSGTDYFPSNSGGNWKCPYGVLRVDIVPTDNFDRTALTNGQTTAFLYPTNNAPAANYATINGAVVSMDCKVATGCDIDINNMASSGSTNYALRLKGLYVDGILDITARDASNNPIQLRGAQIQLDATGRAKDVLRRIQVRLPLSATAQSAPDYAIQSASSICKHFQVSGGNSFVIPNDIVGQDQNNPLCRTVTVSPPAPPPPPPVICTAGQKDIVLVTDVSGSMLVDWDTTTRILKLKEVANRFVVEGSVSPTGNHIGLVPFSIYPINPLDITDDPAVLSSAIASMSATGGTVYLSALQAAETMLAGPSSRAGVPKIVVFISDGQPSDPWTSGPQATSMKAAGTIIYTIAIGKDNTGKFFLQSMTGNGGTYSVADSEAQLDAAISSIRTGLACT